jgi:hypothetical protein
MVRAFAPASLVHLVEENFVVLFGLSLLVPVAPVDVLPRRKEVLLLPLHLHQDRVLLAARVNYVDFGDLEVSHVNLLYCRARHTINRLFLPNPVLGYDERVRLFFMLHIYFISNL